MNIVLIGPRGCGKSTVGRRLAELLDASYVDLDTVVRQTFDETSVVDIWERHGESAWRTAEATETRRVLAGDDQVVALGGGTPIIDDARAEIDRRRAGGRAVVVYLQCPVGCLTTRLKGTSGDRPPLTDHDRRREIEVVLARREPIYLATADHVVDATGDADGVARSIKLLVTGS